MPFPYHKLEAQRPRNPAYPDELKTIGDHIRKMRLDLGLYQKDVANLIGVKTETITYWEKNRVEPRISFIPKIIEFLGYIPLEIGESIPEQLIAYRKIRGLSREDAAADLGVYEFMWWKWEAGIIAPRSRRVIEKIDRLIRYVDEKKESLQE